jgi:hypothetical protein
VEYAPKRTLKVLLEKLMVYPLQRPNTAEAFQRKVMEFRDLDSGLVGTLAEFLTHLKEETAFVFCDDGTALITVDVSGNWLVKNCYPYGGQ